MTTTPWTLRGATVVDNLGVRQADVTVQGDTVVAVGEAPITKRAGQAVGFRGVRRAKRVATVSAGQVQIVGFLGAQLVEGRAGFDVADIITGTCCQQRGFEVCILKRTCRIARDRAEVFGTHAVVGVFGGAFGGGSGVVSLDLFPVDHGDFFVALR